MIYGKSRTLQVLLRMAADASLPEDTLVDLLMDVLADETPCPLSQKESCEFVAVSMFEGRHGGCVTAVLSRTKRSQALS